MKDNSSLLIPLDTKNNLAVIKQRGPCIKSSKRETINTIFSLTLYLNKTIM